MSSQINPSTESLIQYCSESVVVTVNPDETWSQVLARHADDLGLESDEITKLNYFSGSSILAGSAIAEVGKVVTVSINHDAKGAASINKGAASINKGAASINHDAKSAA